MLCRDANFRHYLGDPHARMDNNTAERALRKLTIGRKNWMFIGSEKAGHAMAALLSLTQSCRALGIDPQTYLEDIFRRLLQHPAARLAPHQRYLKHPIGRSAGIAPSVTPLSVRTRSLLLTYTASAFGEPNSTM